MQKMHFFPRAPLTHRTHACAYKRLLSSVLISNPFFYQRFSQLRSSVRFDFHLFSLLQQLCAGELVAHHFKKCIPVGIGSMFDLCEGRKDKICVA